MKILDSVYGEQEAAYGIPSTMKLSKMPKISLKTKLSSKYEILTPKPDIKSLKLLSITPILTKNYSGKSRFKTPSLNWQPKLSLSIPIKLVEKSTQTSPHPVPQSLPPPTQQPFNDEPICETEELDIFVIDGPYSDKMAKQIV